MTWASCLLIAFNLPLKAQTLPLGGLSGLGISNAQGKDTTQKDSSEKPVLKPRKFPKQVSALQFWNRTDTLRFIDSQLLLNHRYTPDQRSAVLVNNLGAPGSPQFNLNHQIYKGGFTLGLPLGDAYLITPDNFNFHEVGQAYTRFQYSQGAGSYTGLEALHTQNFSPTWNITLNYRSVLNEDMYTGASQDNLMRNIGFGSDFSSIDGRYEQQFILSWNRNRRIENGGFVNDTLFYGTTQNISDKPIIRNFGIYVPTLNGAESFLSQTIHQFKHRYFLKEDKKHYIWQELRYQNERFTYFDKSRDSMYYGAAYNYTATKIDDSTSLKSGIQQLGWGFQDTQTLGIFKLELGYRLEYAHLRSQINDTIRQSVWETSNGINILGQWKRNNEFLQLDVSQMGTGYLKNNRNLILTGQHRWSDSSFVELKFSNKQQSPNLFQSYYLSNHFDFRGNVDPEHRIIQNEISSQYGYHSQKMDFLMGIQIGSMQGVIRSWQGPTPTILQPYQYIQSSLNWRYSGTNHWMIVSSIHVQKNNAAEWNNLGLPVLFSRLGLSYQNNAFSKALIYRIGFDANYSSNYLAFQYRSDNRQFYANSDAINLGNYPILDVYFSGRIQTVDFFLKYEHLNNWWVLPFANSRYESTLNYPIQPDRFRFGFVWHFWN